MANIAQLLSVFLSAVAITVSYYCFRLTQRRALQPILAFSNEVVAESSGDQVYWFVENVGNGPAINVTLVAGHSKTEWVTENALRIPALARGAKHRLDWITAFTALATVYFDVHNRAYTTLAYGNANTISERNSLPHVVPNRFLWQVMKR